MQLNGQSQPQKQRLGPASLWATVGTEMKASHGYGPGTRVLGPQGQVHTDDILSINVGGKKYTVRRTDMLADPRSKLADWFRPGSTRLIPSDRGGNIFLDRDPKAFRHILAYLRFKKERSAASLALPSKPDELSKLVGECEALNLVELREMALEMLQKFLRTEEQHYVTSYVQMTMRDLDAWQFEREHQQQQQSGTDQQKKKNGAGGNGDQESVNSSAYDEWDNI